MSKASRQRMDTQSVGQPKRVPPVRMPPKTPTQGSSPNGHKRGPQGRGR